MEYLINAAIMIILWAGFSWWLIRDVRARQNLQPPPGVAISNKPGILSRILSNNSKPPSLWIRSLTILNFSLLLLSLAFSPSFFMALDLKAEDIIREPGVQVQFTSMFLSLVVASVGRNITVQPYRIINLIVLVLSLGQFILVSGFIMLMVLGYMFKDVHLAAVAF
jgi:hypothetical protein